MKKNVAIVHFNTPELTRATILSLWKHTPDCHVTVFDNSDRRPFEPMEGVTLISTIEDFIYHDPDYYDTVYHLLTEPARRCTAVWVRDLKAALAADGRWAE